MAEFRSVVDVHLILEAPDGRVLLAERAGGYAAGLLNLPGGKTEESEDVKTAAIREAYEELGVIVDPDDVRFVAVIHHRNPDQETRVGFFFVTEVWKGDPVNAEPDKCAGLMGRSGSDSATQHHHLHRGRVTRLSRRRFVRPRRLDFKAR